jgi:hypothetical protein
MLGRPHERLSEAGILISPPNSFLSTKNSFKRRLTKRRLEILGPTPRECCWGGISHQPKKLPLSVVHTTIRLKDND